MIFTLAILVHVNDIDIAEISACRKDGPHRLDPSLRVKLAEKNFQLSGSEVGIRSERLRLARFLLLLHTHGRFLTARG
jgi:hypothetical protein